MADERVVSQNGVAALRPVEQEDDKSPSVLLLVRSPVRDVTGGNIMQIGRIAPGINGVLAPASSKAQVT
jgi:hypothetical protein